MRRLFDFLPQSNNDQPPARETADVRERDCPWLNTIVPTDPNVPYNIKDVSFFITFKYNVTNFVIQKGYQKSC